ncbi:fungal-specific transcription factor domain-containing protein [Xylogone sp. PMI_703]|nr:fungal-specific transcription factor domain-containing protein [Xylogone sp. PMI_703]
MCDKEGPISAQTRSACLTCHQRKVKCDKQVPCSGCVRLGIECTLLPRRTRKARALGSRLSRGTEDLLLSRLRKLEGLVEEGNPHVGVPNPNPVPLTGCVCAGSREDNLMADELQQTQRHHSLGRQTGEQGPTTPQRDEGRLLIDGGRSRYLSDRVRITIGEEIEDTRGALPYDHAKGQLSNVALEQQLFPSYQAFVFGQGPSILDLQSLYPPFRFISIYWRRYCENVDPLVKIVHKPTLEMLIQRTQASCSNMSRSTVALLFSIFFAAVNSMTPEDTLTTFEEEQGILLSRLGFAVQHALAQAHFLITREIETLQALTIYLISLRATLENSSYIWPLTGVALRIAQAMELHRDGNSFPLSPFQTEMRRRLWWQIYELDNRASQDQGLVPSIAESSSDTRIPLNINDADLAIDTLMNPPESLGCTDLTFSIIVCRLSSSSRVIRDSSQHSQSSILNTRVPENIAIIRRCEQIVRQQHLNNCDNSSPLCWLQVLVTKVMVAKMWLDIYHPLHSPGTNTTPLSRETERCLFITCVEMMENTILVENEPRLRKWAWLFRSYIQWKAIFFVLVQLCTLPRSLNTDRA